MDIPLKRPSLREIWWAITTLRSWKHAAYYAGLLRYEPSGDRGDEPICWLI